MRSKMGCAESGAWNPYFCSVSRGEPRTSYSRGCAKYLAWSWGIMPKMRLFKAQFCSLYMASSSGLDRVWSVFLRCAKMPRTAGKMGFLHCRSQIANMKVKIGVSEKRAKYISGAAPIMIFVFCGVAPCFRQKKVFPKSTKFRWNHWKRSAKLARPQNAIFAPKSPKWAILVRVTKRSRYTCRCILLPFAYIFKKTRTIVWYFLLFSFLTTSLFLSF